MSQALRITALMALADHHQKRLSKTLEEKKLLEHAGASREELHDALDILEAQGLVRIRSKTLDGAYHPEITPGGLLAVEQLREAGSEQPDGPGIGF